METDWWWKRAPFRTIPRMNEWVRWNNRPTLPTISGKRPASRRLARRVARAEAGKRWFLEQTLYTMERYADIMRRGRE